MKHEKNKQEEKWQQGEAIQQNQEIPIYQEKQSYQKFIRETYKWQSDIRTIGLACAMILLGIFIRLVFGGLG